MDMTPLLLTTTALIDTMYAVHDPFSLVPSKKHIATCINYSDLVEMRAEFVQELCHTAIPFVYSKEKQAELLLQLRPGRGDTGAWSELMARSRRKFRHSDLRGQFSELLLCALLQHYFKAAPLMRKMSLTTNPLVERHGADAIHIAHNGTHFELFLGEAKTYNRKKGGFREALIDAVTDVIEKHHNHRNELGLYVYEDFIPANLEQVARDYKEGRLANTSVQLVCIVTYDNKDVVVGATREARLNAVMASVRKAASDPHVMKSLNAFDKDLVPRLTYIIFPVTELSNLIEEFKRTMGLS